MKSKRLDLKQIFRFLVIGAVNTIFGYAIYFITFRISNLVVAAVFFSTICGVAFNYFTTGRIVFNKRGNQFLAPFLLAYGVIFLFNWASVEALISIAAIQPELAQLLLLPLIAAFSYVLLRFFVFEREKYR